MPKGERLRLGLLKLGELAQRVGVPVTTLRHYAMLGLIPCTQRLETGYRLYEEETAMTAIERIHSRSPETSLVEMRR